MTPVSYTHLDVYKRQVLAEYKAKGDQAAIKALVDRVAGTLTAFLLVLTAVAVLAAPWVMRVFAPGFSADSEQARLATEMPVSYTHLDVYKRQGDSK